MGLDVYLERFNADPAVVRRETEECDRRIEQAWEDAAPGVEYEHMTEDQKELARLKSDEIKDEYGIVDYRHPKVEEVKLDSERHPEHLFKIGYWRSSYNSGGIDRVMRDAIGLTLAEIAGVEDPDDWRIAPDWPATWERAVAAREKLAASIAEDGGVSIHELSFNPFIDPKELPTSRSEALERYRAQRKEHADQRAKRRAALEAEGKTPEEIEEAMEWPSGWYSNREGEWFLRGEPLKVRAAIPGLGEFIGRTEPRFYLVVECAEGEGLQWYVDALDVVVETCEWVLAQDDPSRFLLVWSH